ncbi:hypothetical protein EUGRSUZ_I01230 [Eucalyptus grandis]|uniref:Uncharacterized protein n=2 Tax=Eucalyptus grandis TaxID=71139 RepID=A0ACC3JF34_EUCGR|nr:hypothetical protein EUGRSUZ_I01230 [Eucalyptus grandis]
MGDSRQVNQGKGGSETKVTYESPIIASIMTNKKWKWIIAHEFSFLSFVADATMTPALSKVQVKSKT